jgi:hypothetical protein
MARRRKRQFPNSDARNEMKRISPGGLWLGCEDQSRKRSAVGAVLEGRHFVPGDFRLGQLHSDLRHFSLDVVPEAERLVRSECFSIQPNAPAVISSSTVSIRFLG